MIYEKNKEKHQGSIVHKRIKDSGYPLKYIAEQLNRVMKMSRNTLYARLRQQTLTPKLLFKIGRIINHDFTQDFQQLKQNPDYIQEQENTETPESRHYKQLARLQMKYYKTLEESNKLLKFLIRIVNENKLYSLKKKIDVFIDQNSTTNDNLRGIATYHHGLFAQPETIDFFP